MTDTPGDGTNGDKAGETKGERTRRRLLDLAVERFGARGYKATSVSEIARAAGLTQAAAYAYFDSKEALFDAAVDADADALITETAEQISTVAANQVVPMLVILFLAGLDSHLLIRRVLGGQEPEALARLINLPALRRITSAIEERVVVAQRAGEVRSDLDAEMFANGAETIILSLLMSVTQIGGTTEERRQRGVVAVFDAALRPSPDRDPRSARGRPGSSRR